MQEAQHATYRKAMNIGSVDHLIERPSELTESPSVPKVTQQSLITFRSVPLESPWHPAEHPSIYKVSDQKTIEHPASSEESVTSHGGSTEL